MTAVTCVEDALAYIEDFANRKFPLPEAPEVTKLKMNLGIPTLHE